MSAAAAAAAAAGNLLRITAIVGSDRYRIPCSGNLTVKELIGLRTIDNIRLSDQDLVGNLLGDSDVVVCLTVAPEDGEAQPGELVGHYLLQRQIGEGTFGFVFQATDLNMNRPVAVKVLRRSKSNQINTRRFLREAELNGRLSVDPHIVTVYDFGHTANNRLFIVMELLQGCPLDQLLEERIRSGLPFSMLECIRLIQPVLSALQAAHNHKPMIVHRDLKPENLWLTPAYLELFNQLRQDHQQSLLPPPAILSHPAVVPEPGSPAGGVAAAVSASAAVSPGGGGGNFLGLPQPQPLHRHERAWLSVLLNNQGRLGRSGEPLVKLMDFGIAIYDEESPAPGLSEEPELGPAASAGAPACGAKLDPRRRTKACGTRMYASPEQMRSGSRLDGRSDIWSVGVLMYQLLSLAEDLPWDTFELARARRSLLKQPSASPLGHQRLSVPRVPCLREFGPRNLQQVLYQAHLEAAAAASAPGSSNGAAAPAAGLAPLPPQAWAAPISDGMSGIVHRCLELDAEARWSRVEDLAAALHAEEMALIRELYPYPFPFFGFAQPVTSPPTPRSLPPTPSQAAGAAAGSAGTAPSMPSQPSAASVDAQQQQQQQQLLEAAVPVPASAAESAVLADALIASLERSRAAGGLGGFQPKPAAAELPPQQLHPPPPPPPQQHQLPPLRSLL